MSEQGAGDRGNETGNDSADPQVFSRAGLGTIPHARESGKVYLIEANELLECFQWSDTDYDLIHVGEELADVMVYCQNMLDALGLDADAIINAKMDQNEAKYPVGKCRGSNAKYDQL